MIPHQLTLKYFLSYQAATLDFTGLHTACICGANGAGKSSLLEGITWALWGKSRASSDDVIQTGAEYVRVDFTFGIGLEVYRVIRSGHRGRSAGELQFQIRTVSGKFRSISEKTKRATQEKINETLKLNYDTFVNSAYLRQGHADEFMQSSPSDRKKVLADLLKLEQYETLASQAKDAARQFKTQSEVLQNQLMPLQTQLGQRDVLTQTQTAQAEAIATLKTQTQATQTQWETLRDQSRDRRRLEEQLHWQQTQFQRLLQDAERLTQEQAQLQQQATALHHHIDQADEITANYQQLQTWQRQQAAYAEYFQTDQAARQRRQALVQQLEQAKNQLQLGLQQTQTELKTLDRQAQELQPLLAQASGIQSALTQLQACRQQLQVLEQNQLKVAPLHQRRQILQLEIGQVEARFRAQWESLGRERAQLLEAKTQGQPLRQQLLTVEAEVENLDKKRVYQQRVIDKAQEQNTVQARLQAQVQTITQELGEAEQTWQRLAQADAHCPMCERALVGAEREQVLHKIQVRQDTLQQQTWVLREQIADCEHQREKLQQEATALTHDLQAYDRLVQKRGQLEAKLNRVVELQEQIWTLDERLAEMARSLETGEYALERQRELAELERAIAALNYDEQHHSQLRTQERELRWADAKAAKLQDAEQRLKGINQRRPDLQTQAEQQQAELDNLHQTSPLQQQITAIDQELETIGYDAQAHQTLLQQLQQARTWELTYQNLQQAQQRLPELQEQQQQLTVRQTQQQAEQTQAQAQITELASQMETLPDHRAALETLEQTRQQQQQQLADLQLEQGKIEQSLTQLAELETQCQATQERLTWLGGQHRIYQELAQAFGKNGIQALMIENLLPQLEAETNHLLARLTGNQLHVQFVTQKATKASRSRKKATKMIDTLEILIADAQGTRPYETYSGGEAFRINFAIRLALAKLLAQRSGAALQMLVIDEGFGTQDTAGCERLIAAINAIAPDFACILAVTHIPQFKEAFTHRIEVQKTAQGSQLQLSN
ncbi:MAG: exonuclease subunit SbcC [Spirulina sp. SIO3F2]|nr:exonuclease subunit SbcC [Spirulina sp. SIO3F2]